MAVLAGWMGACKDYRAILAPGERALLPVLAQTKDQAVNGFNFICGAFAASPALRGLVEGQNSDTLSLASGVDIVVRPASFRSARGATTIACICDETAFWHSESSANPDTEILRALRPSLMTTKGPLIAISSPYSRKGELWKAYAKHYGKDSRVLVAQAASWVMHPGLDPSFIAEQYEDDPVSANAEYGANFRSDVDAFVRAEVVEDAVVRGCHELMPSPKSSKYHGFCDPSGGSQDSFTLSIAHGDGDIAVLDCIREFRPPFSPENVVAELAGVLRSYGLREVTGDAYSGEFVRELFRGKGISYNISKKSKSEIYIDLLPMLNSGRVALLDHPKMVAQLCGLERRTTRGTGRDSIDHAPNSHDDLINAAAGALCLANLGPMPLNFHAPITGPGRSAWIAEAGFPISAADGVSTAMPPSGWPAGSPQAGGLDAQLGWSINQRN